MNNIKVVNDVTSRYRGRILWGLCSLNSDAALHSIGESQI